MANMGRRMQSIDARKNYRNSFVCAAKIFKDEGLLTFWSGAVPRLARLILSGGIVFTMYVFQMTSSLNDCIADPLTGTRKLWKRWISWIRRGSTYDRRYRLRLY